MDAQHGADRSEVAGRWPSSIGPLGRVLLVAAVAVGVVALRTTDVIGSLPLPLLGGFVTLVGLGGIWAGLTATDEKRRQARRSGPVLGVALAHLPLGAYRVAFVVLGIGILAMGLVAVFAL